MKTTLTTFSSDEEAVEALKELMARAESGEACGAFRFFMRDGTHQDVAIGGTAEEQALALAELQSKFSTQH